VTSNRKPVAFSHEEKQGTPQFAKRASVLSISGAKVKMLSKPDQILTFRRIEACDE